MAYTLNGSFAKQEIKTESTEVLFIYIYSVKS